MFRLPFPSVLWVFLLLSAAGAAIPFPHEGSDLRADPQVRFGVLPNGLRYAIRENHEPKQRVSFRLLVEAGAVHEKDDQQGLAHFLEHMAFNGSTHYKPGTLVEYFQRMGMSFGGDTNASTWYTRTLYLLELPDTKEATLDEGIKVFGDYAAGLSLLAEEIDRERGIILSEKRTRDSVGYRTEVATRNFMLRGTIFQRRDVIGPEAVLQQAGRDRFVDFYDTWYRPELMSIVVVGDIDVATVEKKLTAAFASLKARGPMRAAPEFGRVPEFAGVQPFVHYEAEAPSTRVTIATVIPYTKEPDTAAVRLKYLPRYLSHAMVNRRLSILAKRENSPFVSGSAGVGESYGFYRQTTMSLTCRAEQWSAALAVAEQELRRALEHGFQPEELAEVGANFRNSLEQAVKTAQTRRSDGMADEIAEALLERDVWTSPEDDLALYGPALARLTVDECGSALRKAWTPGHRLVMVTGNAKIAGDDAGAKTVAATYEKSCAVKVEAPTATATAPWAYTDFGPPGKIAKRGAVEDLGVTLVIFENGVRVNLKPTDFEANRIRVNVRIGTGQLTEPYDQPGLAAYASRTFNEGGLGRHDVDELRRILAGRTVSAGFSVGGDAFTLAGATNREDLQLQLQLMTARLTDPGYRPEAARQARKWIEQMYLGFEHTAGGPFSLVVPKLLSGGDHRFGLPAKDEMLRRNLAEVKAWLAPELSRGALEIAIVGDFDPEIALEALARTFGALPPRQPRPPLEDLRRVRFPAEPFVREFSIATEIPKGEVALFWPTTDGRNIGRARRLNLLAEVLSDRLRVKVREELGDAYDPGVGSAASEVYPGFGYVQASVTIEPTRARQVADIITQIAQDLATRGVRPDELERAKKPVLTNLRESARTNQYWIGSVLARAQEKPEVLEWCRTRYADNEGIGTEELSVLAKEYLGADRASRVIVVPVSKSSGG